MTGVQTCALPIYHADDTYVPLEKQRLMMKVISVLYNRSLDALKTGVPLSDILSQGLFERAIKMKYDIPNSRPELFDGLISDINDKIDALIAG